MGEKPSFARGSCADMDLVQAADSGDGLKLNMSRRPREVPVHPVETIQESQPAMMRDLELTTYKNVYGAHFPAYVKMQEHFLEQVGRAPHLPSSKIALEIFRGDDIDIDFRDTLGDHESSGMDLDAHLAMERKLGIQVKGDF